MKNVRLILMALFALMLFGCGGSGGSGGSSGTGPSSSSQVSVFAADDLNKGYDHVWVTIKKVTLQPGAVAVYSDSAGTAVDLSSLHDSSGAKYACLSTVGVPAGNYTSVDIVMDQNLTLFPTGATTGQARLFKNADSATSTATLTFSLGRVLAVKDSLVVDFDLSQWTDDGTYVTAVVKDGDRSTIDQPGRHDDRDAGGKVSQLQGTPPTQTFTLTNDDGATLSVATDANTVIYLNDGTTNASLANDEKVHVRGKFDPTTKTFLASVIRVATKSSTNKDQGVKGAPSNIDSTAGTFTVAIKDSFGFLPPSTSLNVATTDTTKYFGSKGHSLAFADFFTLLATAKSVEAEGSYDSASNTFTAVALHAESDQDKEDAAARGPVTNINSAAGTFSLGLAIRDGINRPTGAVINVALASNCVCYDPSLNIVSASAWFTGLGTGSGMMVGVKGSYDPASQTLTAQEVRYALTRASASAQVSGPVTAFDAVANTLTLGADEWKGADLSEGDLVSVTTDSSTTYLDTLAKPLDAATFFSRVSNGVGVHAEGDLTAGSSGNTMAGHTLRLLAKKHGS